MKKLISLLALSLLFAGCTSYQLGSNLPKSIQTVAVIVENKTEEPSIEVQTMKSLRKEVQRDGRLKLRSEAEADVVLKVELTGYYLGALAYDSDRGSLAREYRVNMRGKAELYDAETGDVLREVPSVIGNTEFPYDADLTTGKRSALSGAADDLARKVISMTIAAW
jgi:hypothetical protein